MVMWDQQVQRVLGAETVPPCDSVAPGVVVSS